MPEFRRNILCPASGLMMEAVCFFETLASTNESTWRHNPEEHHHPHPHRHENRKSHKEEEVGAGDAVCITKFRNAYIVCQKTLKGRYPLKHLFVDEIILMWILKKWGIHMWTGFIWLRIGTGCWLL
jgi:hypothetical protein